MLLCACAHPASSHTPLLPPQLARSLSIPKPDLLSPPAAGRSSPPPASSAQTPGGHVHAAQYHTCKHNSHSMVSSHCSHHCHTRIGFTISPPLQELRAECAGCYCNWARHLYNHPHAGGTWPTVGICKGAGDCSMRHVSAAHFCTFGRRDLYAFNRFLYRSCCLCDTC